ncbi:Uncharacterized protein HZ326_30818 [Fusarium oxysporum f. sp. albedinis]|nr:Uncharacterized protein HZ326_30818 [Fusarium oxysporum f. sp. albedinis]
MLCLWIITNIHCDTLVASHWHASSYAHNRDSLARKERESSFQEVTMSPSFQASSPATIPNNVGHIPDCFNGVNNATKHPFV